MDESLEQEYQRLALIDLLREAYEGDTDRPATTDAATVADRIMRSRRVVVVPPQMRVRVGLRVSDVVA